MSAEPPTRLRARHTFRYRPGVRLFFVPISLLIILAAGGAGAYLGVRTPVVAGAVLVFALLIVCVWVALEQYRPPT